MKIEKDYFLNCHTEESIKIRYRSLVKQFHPDRCKLPNAKEIFQEVEKQREKALRTLLKNSGKSSEYIEDYLKKVFTMDKEGLKTITDNLSEDFFNELNGKEPTFKDALDFVFKNAFKKKKPDSGNIGSGDQKKLS